MASMDDYPKVTIGAGAPVLKIALTADGVIRVDGAVCNVEALRASLRSIAERKGMVWYYREAAQTKAPPQSIAIMKAIIEHRLPVRLSSKPDYSNSIGMDGKPSGGDGRREE